MLLVRNKLIKILNGWVGTVLFLVATFLILMPHTATLVPFLGAAQRCSRWILIFPLFIILCILNYNIKSFFAEDLFFVIGIAWAIVFAISLHVNGIGVIARLSQQLFLALSMVMLIAIFFKVNLRKYLFILFMYCLVINTINNATILFCFNKGWWATSFNARVQFYAFAGHVNRIYYSVPSMILGIAYSRLYLRSWDLVNLANIGYSLVTGFAADCISQVIFYFIALAAIILCRIYDRFNGVQKVLRWINAKTFMVFNLLVVDAVLLLGHSGWMEKLGLDPRVHGRRALWDHVLETIIDNPIIGSGYHTRIYYEVNGVEYSQPHPHSLYLQIPQETGLIGLTVFIALIVVIIIAIDRTRRFDLRFALGLLFGGLFLIFVIECTGRIILFLLLAILYYIPKCYGRNEDNGV